MQPAQAAVTKGCDTAKLLEAAGEIIGIGETQGLTDLSNAVIGLVQLIPSLTTDFSKRADLMKSRKTYLERFADYPEVVTLPQFCKMLGGIGDSTTRKQMRQNHVKHYYIRTAYMIPKEWAIGYILGTHCAKYRLKLKAQV